MEGEKYAKLGTELCQFYDHGIFWFFEVFPQALNGSNVTKRIRLAC